METALAISSRRSGKDLPYPYKDHPIHRPIEEEEAPTIVEQDSSEDEEEHARVETNPEKYKPLVPYPQALKCPKAKTNVTDDNLLDAF